jgi:hypothetical protein
MLNRYVERAPRADAGARTQLASAGHAAFAFLK